MSTWQSKLCLVCGGPLPPSDRNPRKVCGPACFRAHKQKREREQKRARKAAPTVTVEAFPPPCGECAAPERAPHRRACSFRTIGSLEVG